MFSIFEQTNQLTTLTHVSGHRQSWSTCADYKAEIVLGGYKFQYYQASPEYCYTTTPRYTRPHTPPPPERCIREKSQEQIDSDNEYIEEMKKEAGYTGMPYEEKEEQQQDFWAFIQSLRDEIGDDCIDVDQNYFISAFDFH
ncbi:uncharacterized protein LOC123533013 [Mercenaria mercenaria]|uniref:uncharacterized protein LOC123533013 n=1 Tax=Mercenaria mercenaria TaxID=6596 RepID=UPI00234F06CD|nr:uncharacterized protein LOC123533013 [Mercenaria mercenaria]